MMGDYLKAYEYQKSLLDKKDLDIEDQMDYLLSKPLKNVIGINYLRGSSGEENIIFGVAGIFYQRVLEKNNYGLRVNYASRSFGEVALQFQGDWSHKFSKTFYTQLSGSIGDTYFPKFKISGNAYKYLKHDWQVGLGAGLTRIPTGKDFYNIQGSLSKDVGEFWLNGRLNVFFNEGSVYNNIFAQARYNINDKGDHVVAMASTGNAPQEDVATNFQVNTFLTYTNSMVGAGYRWNKKHKYTYSIQGNWYSHYIPSTTTNGVLIPESRVDQYLLSFIIQTKF